MSQQCMRVFQLCDTISLSGQPIIRQLGIAITDPSVAVSRIGIPRRARLRQNFSNWVRLMNLCHIEAFRLF
jgi:hypothetical protein